MSTIKNNAYTPSPIPLKKPLKVSYPAFTALVILEANELYL